MINIWPIAKLLIDKNFTNLLVCHLMQNTTSAYCLMLITKTPHIYSDIYQDRGKDPKNPKSAGGSKAR